MNTDVRVLLEEIWKDWLTNPQGPWNRVLVRRDDRKTGAVFALDPSWIEFIPKSENHTPYRCDTCAQVWWRVVSAVCPSFRCQGTLLPLSQVVEIDHYRALYSSLSPIGARVEEHTGQLATHFASELQQKFTRGDVNVLSCSTTFELGVDVGEVEAVLLRNVPPSPANYVQRGGRAGRRTERSALVLTFAQRRNHDLWFFREWRRLIGGTVTPPITKVDNPRIARRHLHAMALALWERQEKLQGRGPHKSVEDFFFPEGNAAFEKFVEWLRSCPHALGEAIQRVTPSGAANDLGIASWQWVEHLVNPDVLEGAGWLGRAAREVRTEIRGLDEAYEKAQSEDKLPYAQALQRIRRSIAERSLIDFLAQRVVLPKYGFPVDVVTLDVARPDDKDADKVALERDLQLGIVDFAPGNVLVANKVLWDATGLRVPPGKAPPRRKWAVCHDCKAFSSRLSVQHEEEGEPWLCPFCQGNKAAKGRIGTFVMPIFGFLGQRSQQRVGESRPPRYGIVERFFDEYEGEPPAPSEVQVNGGAIHICYSRQARITVVNRGRKGFHLCMLCGYIREAGNISKTTKKNRGRSEHDRPGPKGGSCNGNLSYYQLGHQFLTDAVELRLGAGIMEKDTELSVLAALLGAAPAVGISENDVDGTVAHRPATLASLALFDAVPGGAGYASHLSKTDVLRELIKGALNRVAACECGEDSSCYSCLRSYRNQAFHDQLRRGDAKRVLSRLVG